MNKLQKEVDSLSADDVRKKIVELKKELLKDHVQVLTGVTPKSAGRIRRSKRMIARMKMVLARSVKVNA